MYRHHQSESQYHYDPVLLTIDWIILSNNTTIRHQVCLFCVHPSIGGDLLYTIFTDWIVIPWSLCKCDQITRLTLACHFPPPYNQQPTPQDSPKLNGHGQKQSHLYDWGPQHWTYWLVIPGKLDFDKDCWLNCNIFFYQWTFRLYLIFSAKRPFE